MKHLVIRILLKAIFLFGILTMMYGQNKETIALISIDTRNLEIDNTTMANVIRFELEKIDQFEVLDKYDVSNVLMANNMDSDDCFGKNAVVAAGKLLNADKMLTGSAELFGDKIIMILRLVDVKSERIEQTSVMEYLDAQGEIQTMSMISLNELLGIENDPHLVDLLINYNLPITTMKTTVSLNGPRMGLTLMTGDNGRRLRESKDQGGYEMYPITSMFGYQYEQQYLSSGDFQALIEVIGAINGLETGNIIPSVTFLNGFRFNNTGFEFGLGPILRVVKTLEGYYDENGDWVSVKDIEIPRSQHTDDLIDSRGTARPSVGLIIALGKTFRSGYLNMPVNLYISPRKDGTVWGLTFGFNTAKKPSFRN